MTAWRTRSALRSARFCDSMTHCGLGQRKSIEVFFSFRRSIRSPLIFRQAATRIAEQQQRRGAHDREHVPHYFVSLSLESTTFIKRNASTKRDIVAVVRLLSLYPRQLQIRFSIRIGTNQDTVFDKLGELGSRGRSRLSTSRSKTSPLAMRSLQKSAEYRGHHFVWEPHFRKTRYFFYVGNVPTLFHQEGIARECRREVHFLIPDSEFSRCS